MKREYNPVHIRNGIECKTFERQINAFMKDRLTPAQTQRFLQHYDSCRSCNDELSVQFLINVGMEKLETGETLNLQKELTEYCAEEHKKSRMRSFLAICSMGMEVLTFIAFIMVFYLMTTLYL